MPPVITKLAAWQTTLKFHGSVCVFINHMWASMPRYKLVFHVWLLPTPGRGFLAKSHFSLGQQPICVWKYPICIIHQELHCNKTSSIFVSCSTLAALEVFMQLVSDQIYLSGSFHNCPNEYTFWTWQIDWIMSLFCVIPQKYYTHTANNNRSDDIWSNSDHFQTCSFYSAHGYDISWTIQ